MNSRSWLTFLLVVFTTSLFAQSQQEMNFQAERDAAKADKELNQVYKKVLAGQDADGAKLLKESQRAWIAYRDAEAKFAADEARGGSMAPMLYSGTLATLTEERVKRLKQSLGEQDAPAETKEEARPKQEPEVISSGGQGEGAANRHQAAMSFFEAYKAHDRHAARAVATEKVLAKLVWDKNAVENPTLKLMDDTHIYYEGGSIELKMQKTNAGRWLVGDIGMTAD